MKKVIPILIMILAVLGTWVVLRFVIGGPEDDWICVDGQWVKHGMPSAPMPSEPCVSDCQLLSIEECVAGGCVVCPPCIECSSLSCQTKSFCESIGFDKEWYEKIKEQISNFNDCAAAGFAVMESYPRQCRDGLGNLYVEDIGNELEKIDLIRIDNPRPNQFISSPLGIEGQARGYWFFEGDFPVKLLDSNGNLVASGIASAQGEWMTEDFVDFKAELTFSQVETERGSLILQRDNPSGLPENEDELRVPVVFGQAQMMSVKVYFNNNQLDPEMSCNKVFSVERQVAKTQAVARAALEELLKGTTAAEENQGYLTNINSGVKIQSLTIEDGLAKVDFDEQLELQVGGSCRVAAIRAQITETLKQFDTVDEVIISVNGRTEDILQP